MANTVFAAHFAISDNRLVDSGHGISDFKLGLSVTGLLEDINILELLFLGPSTVDCCCLHNNAPLWFNKQRFVHVMKAEGVHWNWSHAFLHATSTDRTVRRTTTSWWHSTEYAHLGIIQKRIKEVSTEELIALVRSHFILHMSGSQTLGIPALILLFLDGLIYGVFVISSIIRITFLERNRLYRNILRRLTNGQQVRYRALTSNSSHQSLKKLGLFTMVIVVFLGAKILLVLWMYIERHKQSLCPSNSSPAIRVIMRWTDSITCQCFSRCYSLLRFLHGLNELNHIKCLIFSPADLKALFEARKASFVAPWLSFWWAIWTASTASWTYKLRCT